MGMVLMPFGKLSHDVTHGCCLVVIWAMWGCAQLASIHSMCPQFLTDESRNFCPTPQAILEAEIVVFLCIVHVAHTSGFHASSRKVTLNRMPST